MRAYTHVHTKRHGKTQKWNRRTRHSATVFKSHHKPTSKAMQCSMVYETRDLLSSCLWIGRGKMENLHSSSRKHNGKAFILTPHSGMHYEVWFLWYDSHNSQQVTPLTYFRRWWFLGHCSVIVCLTSSPLLLGCVTLTISPRYLRFDFTVEPDKAGIGKSALQYVPLRPE